MRAPEFWYPRSDERNGSLASTVLLPLSWLYQIGARIREVISTPYHSSVPIICIGNISVGGTGKTPLCQALAQQLQSRGHRVSVVTRGYGGSIVGPVQVDVNLHSFIDVGDEPLLLAQNAKVFLSQSRKLGIQAAEKDGATVILLDDGFQNPTIAKDFSLLVFDSPSGVGNGRVLPSGPLRQSTREGLSRADAVFVMGSREAIQPRLANALSASGKPQFLGHFEPDLNGIADKKLIAFAGIGRPQKFFDMLSDLRLNTIETIPYPDHHPYNQRDQEWLVAFAKDRDAELVTTEKDALRLPQPMQKIVHTVPIKVVFEDLDALLDILDPVLASATEMPKTTSAITD